MNGKCPICGKEFETFSIKEFADSPKTTLFGKFKTYDMNGNVQIVSKKTNQPVCSEECKQKNEGQYFVEEYKGCKIYCIDGKLLPYLDCDYWYNSIEDIKNRIDNPHRIPVTSAIIIGLSVEM